MIKQLSEILILQRGMNINFKSATCHTKDSSVTASDMAFILTIIIPKVRHGFFLSLGMQIPSPIKSPDLLYIWADRAKSVVWGCCTVKSFLTLDSWLTQRVPQPADHLMVERNAMFKVPLLSYCLSLCDVKETKKIQCPSQGPSSYICTSPFKENKISLVNDLFSK